MVGRSRRSSGPTEYLTSASIAEMEHLEANNLELAKALAEVKNLYKQALNEKNHFQQQFFTATLRLRKLENYLNNIDGTARQALTSVLTLSDHMGDVVSYIASSKRLLNMDQPFNLSSASYKSPKNSIENKMQVVKPMISGHVILRPTINLRRVNEFSTEEIESLQMQNSSERISVREDAIQNNSTNNDSFQRLSNTRNQRVSDRQYVEEAEDNEDNDDDVNDDELDESMHSSDLQMEINNRLVSIEEERDSDMETDTPSRTRRYSLSSNRSGGASLTLPSTSSQIPLLSGVFKDVRVYLSPVDPHCNITKVRGSNKAHLKRSSEIPTSRFRGSLSHNSLTDSLNTPERNPTENSMHMSNELRTNSGLNTPNQSVNVYNENETRPSIASNFEIDGVSDRNNDVNNKIMKRRLEGNKRHTEYISHPKKLVFTRSARSTIGNGLLNNDYDPLEGPSNLLDSNDANKLETLYGLGLTPVSEISMTPSTSSPVIKLRKRKTIKIEENGTPKQRPRPHVTKRKSEKTKKKTRSSSVLVSRVSSKKSKNLSISPNRTSLEYNKRRTRKRFHQELLDTTHSSTPSTSNSSIPMPTSSPPRIKKSPIKRESMKRLRSKVSLKEPSLRHKLRRSK